VDLTWTRTKPAVYHSTGKWIWLYSFASQIRSS